MRDLRPLSRPTEEVWARRHDIVVVGSGYGGAVAACRLARAGQRVTLLERGREVLPRSFPDNEKDALLNLQMSGSQTVLARDGFSDRRRLYWLHVGDEVQVFTGCGLGGTSLINANVSIKPDRAVFADDAWPSELRSDRDVGLEAGFRRAREILQPTPYPGNDGVPYAHGYPRLRKIAALEEAGTGEEVILTDINVRFQGGPNAVGVDQDPCTCCGDCVTGCNVGAKNTLLMNYLPDAVGHGAAIYTEVDVDRLEKAPDGSWVIWARDLAHDHRGEAEPRKLTAEMVVLAAGTMGSTGILLRSRDALALSDTLGARFSGNGDVLGFATGTTRVVGGIAEEPDSRHPNDVAGPCITAAIDRREGRPLAEQLLIEDAVIPEALARAVVPVLAAESVEKWWKRLLHHRRRRAGFVGSLLAHGARSTLEHVQTYLLMGHEGDSGTIVADDEGTPVVRWPGAGQNAYSRSAKQALKKAAENVGGTYRPDPLSKFLHHELITVHPLGGCAMADGVEGGVVDHVGRVFDAHRAPGSAFHDGLYVWDGSIVPRPLGANPLLTITALAERAVAVVAKEEGWTIDYGLSPPAPLGPTRLPGGHSRPPAGGVAGRDLVTGEHARRRPRGLPRDGGARRSRWHLVPTHHLHPRCAGGHRPAGHGHGGPGPSDGPRTVERAPDRERRPTAPVRAAAGGAARSAHDLRAPPGGGQRDQVLDLRGQAARARGARRRVAGDHHAVCQHP